MERIGEEIIQQSDQQQISINGPQIQQLQGNSSNNKRKKIKKNRRKKSKREPLKRLVSNSQIDQFVCHQGSAYFEMSRKQLWNHYNQTLKSHISLRKIFSSQQNAYQIKNYEDCKECEYQYRKIIGLSSTMKQEKIGIVSGVNKLAIQYFYMMVEGQKKRKVKQAYFPTNFELIILKNRVRLIEEIREVIERKISQKVDIQANKLQILALCRLNSLLQNKNLGKIELALRRGDPLAKLNQFDVSKSQNYDEYISLYMRKNLASTFDEQPIQFMTYFQQIENYERDLESKTIPTQKEIKTIPQLKNYVKSRQPKEGRTNEYILNTSCSACFSNKYQMANPIRNCQFCFTRVHKLCQQVRDSKCHACFCSSSVKKVTPEERSLIRESYFCFICKRKKQRGLLLQNMNFNGEIVYGHLFCLLSHNNWRVEGTEFKPQYIQSQAKAQACKFCKEEGGHYLQCQNCQSPVHGICGYLAGCSFQMKDKMSPNYKVKVNCCGDGEKMDRLLRERKFKLNYEKQLFRKEEDILNLIK